MVTKKTTATVTKLVTKSSNKLNNETDLKKTRNNGKELIIENFEAMTLLVESLTETLEILIKKTENMACHIIATEEILAEIVADNGLNVAKVNSRIRARLSSIADNARDANRAIDIAATIASPKPPKWLGTED